MGAGHTAAGSDEPHGAHGDKLLTRAVVQTLCRVALDNFGAMQHDVSWVHRSLHTLAASEAFSAPLVGFTDALRSAAEVVAHAATDGDPASVSACGHRPAEALRRLVRACQLMEQNLPTGDGVAVRAIAMLDWHYRLLSDAFGLTPAGPPPRPPLCAFIAAAAFDCDMLERAPHAEQDSAEPKLESFIELMQRYKLIERGDTDWFDN
ncbi:hypothetical protein [Mycetohabitans sp. B46]|uniref:hypothetical protein n=1 Tax=Mycetohabitans sp. B46 TaxID=2772536 RepID=UPI00307FA634